MRYVYPAILYEDNGNISVIVPDLPGCFTFGENKADALCAAKDAVEMWLCDAENKKEPIPIASEHITAATGQITTLIAVDTDEYRRRTETQSVKKTLSIPSWLNAQAEEANAPFSHILQEGLKKYLNEKKNSKI